MVKLNSGRPHLTRDRGREREISIPKCRKGRLENHDVNDTNDVNIVYFQHLRRSTDVKTDANKSDDDDVAKQFSTVECPVEYFVATVSVEFYLYVDFCRRNNYNLFTKRPPQLAPRNYFNNHFLRQLFNKLERFTSSKKHYLNAKLTSFLVHLP